MKSALLVAVVIALLLPACAGGAESNGSGGGSGGDGGTVIRIVVGGDEAASWSLGELERTVTFVDVEIDGDSQSGPRLVDVLAAAGVDDWEVGEVLGKGEGRSFDVGLEISASEVDEGWVLDVSNRGTLKLAAAELPRQEWVRDVAEIRFP